MILGAHLHVRCNRVRALGDVTRADCTSQRNQENDPRSGFGLPVVYALVCVLKVSVSTYREAVGDKQTTSDCLQMANTTQSPRRTRTHSGCEEEF